MEQQKSRRATGTTKSRRESPQTGQANQRHPQEWHQHAKETTEAPKGFQKKFNGLQKDTNTYKKKRQKNKQVETLFL